VSFASWRGGSGGGVAVADDTPADLPADETGRGGEEGTRVSKSLQAECGSGAHR